MQIRFDFQSVSDSSWRAPESGFGLNPKQAASQAGLHSFGPLTHRHVQAKQMFIRLVELYVACAVHECTMYVPEPEKLRGAEVQVQGLL